MKIRSTEGESKKEKQSDRERKKERKGDFSDHECSCREAQGVKKTHLAHTSPRG